MFRIDSFPFPVKIHRMITDEDDAITLRIRFDNTLTEEQKQRFLKLLDTWLDRVFDAKFINWWDDQIRWYTNNTLVVVFMDTGGNDPDMAPYLNDLFREANEIAPLAEVRITPV